MNHLSSIHFHLRNNVYRIPINLKILIIPYSTTLTKIRRPPNPKIADYLMNSFGLSREQAISASKSISSRRALDSLSSVPVFLKQSGLSDTQIRNLICKRPKFLSLHVEKTVRPKISFLQGLGFSGSSLADFILHNLDILFRGHTYYTANIDFLRSFLHSDENVIKAIKRNNLLSFNIQKTMLPNIEFLRRYGVAEEQISSYLVRQPRFFSIVKPDKLKERIAWAENMGLKRESRIFIHAIHSLSSMDRAALEAKIEIYKSFGWSESDIESVFKKIPWFLAYSESRVRAMMGFFLEEFGFEPKEIASRPRYLNHSLEKRLVPRNKVLKILNSRGLAKTPLRTVVRLSEKKFLENYVLPYLELAPELEGAYMANAVNVEMRKTKG